MALTKLAFDYYKRVKDTEHGAPLQPGEDPRYDESVESINTLRKDLSSKQGEQLKGALPYALAGTAAGALIGRKTALSTKNGALLGLSTGMIGGGLTPEARERKKEINGGFKELIDTQIDHENTFFNEKKFPSGTTIPSMYYRQ